MFERYTERARRVIFFARYEASQFGSETIETEHLLLGLVREDNFCEAVAGVKPESIRKEIERRVTVHEKIPTSIDLPLSNECRRILSHAAEEAARMHHGYIGTEHLLLGILREERSLAAEILREKGVTIEAARERLARPLDAAHGSFQPAAEPHLPSSGVVVDEGTAIRIAEAIWKALYNTDATEHCGPSQVEFRHGVWIVTAPLEAGGKAWTLSAFIAKADSRVLKVSREEA